ncbi:hypothetical protein D3C77_683490 [compost metagenome]
MILQKGFGEPAGGGGGGNRRQPLATHLLRSLLPAFGITDACGGIGDHHPRDALRVVTVKPQTGQAAH